MIVFSATDLIIINLVRTLLLVKKRHWIIGHPRDVTTLNCAVAVAIWSHRWNSGHLSYSKDENNQIGLAAKPRNSINVTTYIGHDIALRLLQYNSLWSACLSAPMQCSILCPVLACYYLVYGFVSTLMIESVATMRLWILSRPVGTAFTHSGTKLLWAILPFWWLPELFSTPIATLYGIS